jgi:peptide/nickel transport system substrate-binding protein
MSCSIVVGVVLALVGVELGSASAATAATTPQRGGNLVVARYTNVTTLDPLAAIDPDTIYSLDSVFEPLLFTSPSGQSETPGLALSVTPNADNLTWTVDLRPNVKFSNGQAMTATDVKFSLDRARTSNQSLGYLLAPITTVTVVNPLTVTLTTATPVANIPALLTLWCGEIIPANYAGMTKAQFFKKPIGTGPYMVKSWSPSGKFVVVKNPNYWMPGKPYLNSITWETNTDDSSRVNQLTGGQAQVIQEVPFSSTPSLKTTSGITVKSFASTSQTFLMMSTKYKPLADNDVRQAVAYAMDSKTVAKAVLFGYGSTACSILPPTMLYYDANVNCPNNNLTMAKQLMAKSTYPKGFTVSLLVASQNTEASTVAQIAINELAKIGIKVEIHTVDKSELFNMQSTGNFQIIYQGWASDIPDPDEQLSYMLDPSGGGESYGTYYGNPQITTLLASARSEFDTTQRAADYAQVQTLSAQDGPYVPLLFEPFMDAYSNKVHGFTQLPTGFTFYQNVWLSK